MRAPDELIDPLREELGEFLRRRRAELTPETVGLPRTARRRTPGLRREEVAELAGISVALYAWLEQGRDVPVSNHTVDAIADSLRLPPAERSYLRNLARPEHVVLSETMSPAVSRMVSAMSEHAAYVLDGAWNIVFENARAKEIFGSSQSCDDERNLLKRAFALVDYASDDDRELTVTALVERLQFDIAASGGDPRLLDLASDLARDPRFTRVWERRHVRNFSHHQVVVQHPTCGRLVLETTAFVVADAPGLRLLVLTDVCADGKVRLTG